MILISHRGNLEGRVPNMENHLNYVYDALNKGFEVEMGSFSMKELEDMHLPFGLTIERDTLFEPMKASEVWEQLNNGEHV